MAKLGSCGDRIEEVGEEPMTTKLSVSWQANNNLEPSYCGIISTAALGENSYITVEKGIGCSNCNWYGCHMCTLSAIKERQLEAMNNLIKQCDVIREMREQIAALQKELEENKNKT
jgi:hypothetical protein